MRKQQIPNLLTLGRVAIIPLFMLAFLLPQPLANYLCAALFIVASATDFLDGYLARKWNATSRMGQMLDPIADKLLVACALVLLLSEGRAPAWPAAIILCRELFISGLREFMAKEDVVVKVTQLAKWKTTAQMVAIVLLLFALPQSGLFVIGAVAIWVAAILTLITGWQYHTACLPKLKGDQS